MKTEQSIYCEEKGWQLPSADFPGELAQIVFVFGNRDLLKINHHIDHIGQRYPNAQVVGCSTSGEIFGNEVFSDNIACTAVWFEKTTVEIASGEIGKAEDSFDIGEKLAAKLDHGDLVHVMILSEGLNINGSELTKGMNQRLNDRIPVTGGLSGDADQFIETVVVHNAAGRKNLVLAIGFYGKNIKVGYGSMGGWDSFGVDRMITKSKGNVLYELDNQPALELYKRYLGNYASNLPSSALLFPLSLILSDSETSLVRTVLSVNESEGSMNFAGDLPQGEYVRLMKANVDKLIGGAHDAANMSIQSLKHESPDLAILISCVGRRLVLKQRVEEEVEIVREVIGNHAAVTGFYSYGEISPLRPFDNHCELHNQTMTITVFKEE